MALVPGAHDAIESHLQLFATSTSAPEQLTAIKGLLHARSLTKAAADPRFDMGLEALGTRLHSECSKDVWMAIVCLGRIASVVKSRRTAVRTILAAELRDELPLLLPDMAVEDRNYATSAIRLGRPNWSARFFAMIAIGEESAEKLRRNAVAGLLKSGKTVSVGLEALRAAVGSWQILTADPETTMARRLRRIVSALHQEWARTGQEPGEQAGRQMGLLLEQAGRQMRSPSTKPLLVDLAREVAGVVHQIARTRVSYAADGVTYEPLEVVAGWFTKDDWPDVVQGAVVFSDLVTDVEEGLRSIVRSGLTDSRLLRALALVSGSERRAHATRQHLATGLAGAPAHSLDWLLNRVGKETTSADIEESRWRSTDKLLGDLLVHFDRLSVLVGQARTDIAPALGVIDANSETVLLNLIDHTSDITDEFRRLCEARTLRLFGSIGEMVEFLPLVHEPVGGPQPGRRHARILEPGVQCGDQRAPSRIIRKALVEFVS